MCSKFLTNNGYEHCPTPRQNVSDRKEPLTGIFVYYYHGTHEFTLADTKFINLLGVCANTHTLQYNVLYFATCHTVIKCTFHLDKIWRKVLFLSICAFAKYGARNGGGNVVKFVIFTKCFPMSKCDLL